MPNGLSSLCEGRKGDAELIHDDDGTPDGMKVDMEENVYCTGPGGVWVTDPKGNHVGRILIPEHLRQFCVRRERHENYVLHRH